MSKGAREVERLGDYRKTRFIPFTGSGMAAAGVARDVVDFAGILSAVIGVVILLAFVGIHAAPEQTIPPTPKR